METNKQIKTLRREAIRIFFLLFIPHIVVTMLTSAATNSIDNLKYQLYWFITYFSISIFIYIFAPKIVKK